MNRLKLNFSLDTAEDRAQFIEQYLHGPLFAKSPPTPEELETMGNYILWGKNQNGLNAKQSKDCEISTKHKTWNRNNLESLEELMASPAFSENQLHPLSLASVPKYRRDVFAREDALRQCPDYLRSTFEALFRQIDELDYSICIYELAHNRRTKQPRSTLRSRLSETQKANCAKDIETWSPYLYLKMRHRLVELRREQYTLRDSYAPLILQNPTISNAPDCAPTFDGGIEVLPLGLITPNAPSIFREWDQLAPRAFGDSELRAISDLVWRKAQFAPAPNQFWIDFRDVEHVYQLLCHQTELRAASENDDFESTLPQLLATLDFYAQMADLNEVQRDILDLKLKKEKNIDIATRINKKWGRAYTANYISTIFRQRIIPKINEAAAYHLKVVSNLFFEEEFKECSGCGKTLLRDTINFTRKTRSPDGLAARCKKCEKANRAKRRTN